MRRKIHRFATEAAVISYSLAVTYFVGKFLISYATLERGYESFGGEYAITLILFYVIYLISEQLLGD